MENQFGKMLKQIRTEKGIRQEDLGRALNVANNTVSSWERGNSFPDLEEVILIAKFFGVTTDYLLGLEN